ncbi:MAG: hypothetical protein ACT4OY_09160 [Alphaproteobacteria bacterium]
MSNQYFAVDLFEQASNACAEVGNLSLITDNPNGSSYDDDFSFIKKLFLLKDGSTVLAVLRMKQKDSSKSKFEHEDYGAKITIDRRNPPLLSLNRVKKIFNDFSSKSEVVPALSITMRILSNDDIQTLKNKCDDFVRTLSSLTGVSFEDIKNKLQDYRDNPRSAADLITGASNFNELPGWRNDNAVS